MVSPFREPARQEILCALLKEAMREQRKGRLASPNAEMLSQETGIPVAEIRNAVEPIIAELNAELRTEPLMEYVRESWKEDSGILASVLVLSHERVSYDNTPYVCAECGETYSLGDVKVYHNCRVQYEDGHEQWYRKFYVHTEGCPRCAERSRMKKPRIVRALAGYTLWKYGQRIVAVSHSFRKFAVGQAVAANGKALAHAGAKGHVVRIHEPFKRRTQDILRVRFANGTEADCKFKYLEMDALQETDRPSHILKQQMQM